MPNFLTASLLAVALVVLGGCGQTGPLYMPGETQPPPEPPADDSVAPAQPEILR